jgi:hypothetical protein
MIGYYFIQNKYLYVGNNDKDRDTDINRNDKYTKEMKSPPDKPVAEPVAEPVSSIRMKESFNTEEDENENLIHNNKNKISYYKSIFKRYLFL